MIWFSTVLWLWQSAATPTPQPSRGSDLSFYLLIVLTAVFSFIFGILVTTIFFVSKRAIKKSDSEATQFINEIENSRIPIKQCPKCNSTYTDEDLKFCLRDGITLKVVGSMPVPHDPDKTISL